MFSQSAVFSFFFHSKDVRLPVQLQRVMAAEAEATREARAKVQLSALHHEYLYYLAGFLSAKDSVTRGEHLPS